MCKTAFRELSSERISVNLTRTWCTVRNMYRGLNHHSNSGSGMRCLLRGSGLCRCSINVLLHAVLLQCRDQGTVRDGPRYVDSMQYLNASATNFTDWRYKRRLDSTQSIHPHLYLKRVRSRTSKLSRRNLIILFLHRHPRYIFTHNKYSTALLFPR